MRDYIDNVLANYLSPNIGYSEEEAIEFIKSTMDRSPEFSNGLRRELLNALADPQFPWRASLLEFEILETSSDEKAREYIKSLLWDGLF
jgi:hypothetical protein